jgi:AraC-like DNA-binding protein
VPEAVWEAVAARPAGPLRAVVAEHHGYRQRGMPPARHLGLPSPWLTLIFTLDEPLYVARHPDPQQAPGQYLALLGGLHTTPAVIAHDGAQSGVQLQVSPLAARALLGLPAGELAGLDLPAADLLGRLGADLPEQLQAAGSWAARFRLLDDRLGRLVDPDRTPPPAEVRRAWRVLRASGGTARIADVAREVGWSERHLAARFRTEIGLAPKAAARVIRFDRARQMVPGMPAAVVAATCGYADQAHLVRDFVAFTGLGPRGWLAAEVGNLQDPGVAAAGDWAS